MPTMQQLACGRARCPPARAPDRRRRGPRRAGRQARHAHGRRGGAPHRQRRDRQRDGPQDPARRCPRSAGRPRRSSPTPSADNALKRARRRELRDPDHSRPASRSRRVSGDGMNSGPAARNSSGCVSGRSTARHRLAPDRQPARAGRRDRPGLRRDAGDGQPRHRRPRAAQAPRATARSMSRPRTSPRARRRRCRPRPAAVTTGCAGSSPTSRDGRPRRSHPRADRYARHGQRRRPGHRRLILQEQEGTLAGDNALLVLFADEAAASGGSGASSHPAVDRGGTRTV